MKRCIILCVLVAYFPHCFSDNKMEAHQLVPDILDFVPPHVATVKFPSGVSMSLGNELTPLQVKDAPSEVDFPSEPGALYTILFTDPDAPSRAMPIYREILHWLVINVPSGAEIGKGQTVVPYVGSGPPEGLGLHRYVLTVFKQSATLSADQFDAYQARFKFSSRDFASKFNLQLIAGNLYQAQTDDFLRARNAKALDDALRLHQVIPDLLDAAPQQAAVVFYSSGAFIRSGNELTPTQVKDIPAKILWRAEKDSLYTVMLVDARNAETRSNGGDILHWLVVNSPENAVEKGDTRVEYIGSGPPKAVGINRYVFLIFKQAGLLNLTTERTSNSSISGRMNFDLKGFIKENGLQELVAANFFRSSYDDYVPQLFKQLGLETPH